MADLILYQQIIQDFLTKIHSFDKNNNSNGIESQLIFDTQNHHYLLIDVGWEQKQFVYGTIIHIDIKDDKIWIQRNNTEINLAESLIAKGVKKEDIVLGFHSPFMRQFSDYSVA
jgi:DNA topoisomerase VI subunit B